MEVIAQMVANVQVATDQEQGASLEQHSQYLQTHPVNHLQALCLQHYLSQVTQY